MTQENRCPRCSKPFWQPPGSPRGLCPACLLACGMETNTVGYNDEAQARANWTPPPAEQLAPLFPELDIIELIGRGGMGAVYKAHEKQLDRLVALKILPPEIGADLSFAKRFAREAQAMAKLSHPNIVTIYSFGSTSLTASSQGGCGMGVPPMSPRGVPPLDDEIARGPDAPATSPEIYFFIMEYVDGLSLRQLLDAGTISPKEALAIVPQICDALQYAHDRGIVHRDIKPENILLSRSGQVKIADFGLAKLVSLAAPGATRAPSASEGEDGPSGPGLPSETLAKEGEGAAPEHTHGHADVTKPGEHILGTPQYMAPEQIDRPREVDHRADIYSLGVVFYQMLTGELPKGRPGAAFEPPSRKVLIDVRLDEVVLRALEREPARRYQQVSEIKTRVETIVATRPAGAAGGTRPPTIHPASGGTQKRELIEFRWIVIPLLIMPAMLVLLFVGGGMPWQEVPFIWLPWLGIMLGIAGASFAAFWGAGRSRSMVLRLGSAVGFLCLFLFGAVSLATNPGGDPLVTMPVLALTVFFLIYAVVLFVLASYIRTRAAANGIGFEPAIIFHVGLHLAAMIAVLVLFMSVVPDYRKYFRDACMPLLSLPRLFDDISLVVVRWSSLFVPAALLLVVADTAIMLSLGRAGRHVLVWTWSLLVLLGLLTVLGLGAWAIAAQMRYIGHRQTAGPKFNAPMPEQQNDHDAIQFRARASRQGARAGGGLTARP